MTDIDAYAYVSSLIRMMEKRKFRSESKVNGQFPFIFLPFFFLAPRSCIPAGTLMVVSIDRTFSSIHQQLVDGCVVGFDRARHHMLLHQAAKIQKREKHFRRDNEAYLQHSNYILFSQLLGNDFIR